jgi:hypothetical protein
MEKAKYFLSRRGLIAALGGVAAVGVLVAARYRAVLAVTVGNAMRGRPGLRPMFASLANASVEQWLEQVGSIFTVGGGTSLKLVGVSAMSSPGARPHGLGRNEAFLAKFDVQDGGTMAGDLIYVASHPLYGAFRIFLSASSDPRLPHRMTALFN